MANLKAIRTRIGSVKSTQKITRAMKMVAGARLNRAQLAITALRPYAIETADVFNRVVGSSAGKTNFTHPLLESRPEKTVLLLIITSDRGLCGSFNSSILKHAERAWKAREAAGQKVKIAVIGRKGRDFVARAGIKDFIFFPGVIDDLSTANLRYVARQLLTPFVTGEVDSISIIYNEFKSAMTQLVKIEQLLPAAAPTASSSSTVEEFVFEPDESRLLEALVPMYIETSLKRVLYESRASELGSRMTAMDSATKNASDLISNLTLQYNRARQAAITTELTEIIGGADALSG